MIKKFNLCQIIKCLQNDIVKEQNFHSNPDDKNNIHSAK